MVDRDTTLLFRAVGQMLSTVPSWGLTKKHRTHHPVMNGELSSANRVFKWPFADHFDVARTQSSLLIELSECASLRSTTLSVAAK